MYIRVRITGFPSGGGNGCTCVGLEEMFLPQTESSRRQATVTCGGVGMPPPRQERCELQQMGGMWFSVDSGRDLSWSRGMGMRPSGSEGVSEALLEC